VINQELLTYIENELKIGESKDIIQSNLLSNGWNIQDVNEGFSLIIKTDNPQTAAAVIDDNNIFTKHIHHHHFLIFSLYSLFFSLMLGFLVIQQTQTPIAYAEEIYIPHKHIKDTKILVFGDMMLDRAVRKQINDNGNEYPFSQIKDFILGNDIVVANAEGSFSFFDSKTLDTKNGPLDFTFDPILLTTLKNIGFTLLGQANNHALNFGSKGFAQSTTSITIAGLNYFGDPRNIDIAPYITEINGEKIGLIAYNEFSYEGFENIIRTIQEVKKQVTYLIVYSHWGEEYNSSFTLAQQKNAHDFIDAGVDAVIGMHPHVIEPIEIYNGKPIFYSIGNFIFDQAEIGPMTEGLAIKILLNKKSITYEISPFFIKQAQVSLMDNVNRQTILNALVNNAVIPDDFKAGIATGRIKIDR
jgi:poly-gamma-glutamate synthesis protein (capsule biosynthesis protein)